MSVGLVLEVVVARYRLTLKGGISFAMSIFEKKIGFDYLRFLVPDVHVHVVLDPF